MADKQNSFRGSGAEDSYFVAGMAVAIVLPIFVYAKLKIN